MSPEKRWDVALYEEKHSFVWKSAADLIELLAPRRGERILDVGCGTGHLTHQIAASGAEVIGIDKDLSMIAQARKNYPDVRFEVADGNNFHLGQPFDAVFSNAVLHWLKNPDGPAACIHRALKPGGRFVAEFGGRGNVSAIIGAIYRATEALGFGRNEELNPWYFPSIGEYSTLLERHGFEVTYAALFARPTLLEDGEAGMRRWIEMFAGHFLLGIPADQRVRVMEKTEELLRPELFRDGSWFADYRRIRIVATKEREE